MLINDYELVQDGNMADVPIATSASFQTKARPRMAPVTRQEMLWMMVPSVIPAKPLTFCGFSLNWAVREPVCDTTQTRIRHQGKMITYTVALLVEEFN